MGNFPFEAANGVFRNLAAQNKNTVPKSALGISLAFDGKRIRSDSILMSCFALLENILAFPQLRYILAQ